MSAPVDEPIGYDLTEAGWAAAGGAVSTLTAGEVAKALHVSQTYVNNLARTGAVEAVKVDRTWLIDGHSVQEYLRRPSRSPHRRLPAAPLLRQIELAGGDYAVGVRQHTAAKRMLERAREDGSLTLGTADRLAVQLLGLTLWELWSADELA